MTPDLCGTDGDLGVDLSTDACLKCNVCLTLCPVARVTDLFPGPKYVGPQAQRFRAGRSLPVQTPGVPSVKSPDVTVDWCSGCGWCTASCPAGVKIAELNSRSRARLKAGRRPKLRDWGLGQTDLVGRVGQLTWPISNWALANRPIRAAMELAFGIHRHAPFPKFGRRTLQSKYRRRPRNSTLPGPEEAVVYFHGCSANYYEMHVAEATIEVLKRNGLQVIVPEQVCCGLPLISNGIYAEARQKARRNIELLAPYARQGYRIVGTSTSCTHTIKAEYREMLDLCDDDATLVANMTWDICELLADLHDKGRLNTRFGELKEEVAYHAPCQLRSQGIGLPALDLLGLVPGMRASDMDHDCCGIAGTYGMKKEKYAIAMAVGEPLFERIRQSGVAVAACDSETCRWQIQAATGIPVRHPVEILCEAYRAADRLNAAALETPPEGKEQR